MQIDTPGIYPNIEAADYYKDPCPAPSLTQTLVKIMLERSPLHAWTQHPRLNPDYRETDGREAHFDIGTIAHALLLGRGRELVLTDYEDWRTKAAQETRAKATEAGKIAILPKHHRKADAMVRAAREQLDLRGCAGLFFPGDGDAEACLAWQERNIWLRQLVDWISTDRAVVADYKTTGESAAPASLGRKLVDWGWHIQAAMAERGLDNLNLSVGRRRYLWVCQETTPPYQLTITEIGEAALTLGRWQLNTAIDLWQRCVETNQFPGYPLCIEQPDLPPWHSTTFAEQIQVVTDSENAVPSDILIAG